MEFVINPDHAKFILIFTNFKLWLATATNNFKWMTITHICSIWAEIFANLDV